MQHTYSLTIDILSTAGCSAALADVLTTVPFNLKDIRKTAREKKGERKREREKRQKQEKRRIKSFARAQSRSHIHSLPEHRNYFKCIA